MPKSRSVVSRSRSVMPGRPFPTHRPIVSQPPHTHPTTLSSTWSLCFLNAKAKLSTQFRNRVFKRINIVMMRRVDDV